MLIIEYISRKFIEKNVETLFLAYWAKLGPVLDFNIYPFHIPLQIKEFRGFEAENVGKISNNSEKSKKSEARWFMKNIKTYN